MEDSEMRSKVGAKGREKVEREFAISCVAKKLVSLFAQQ